MKKKLTRPDFLVVDVELDFRNGARFSNRCYPKPRVCRWEPSLAAAAVSGVRRLFQSAAYDVCGDRSPSDGPRSSQKVRNEEKKLTRPVDVELDFRLELDFRPVAILNRVCVGGAAPAPGPGRRPRSGGCDAF